MSTTPTTSTTTPSRWRRRLGRGCITLLMLLAALAVAAVRFKPVRPPPPPPEAVLEVVSDEATAPVPEPEAPQATFELHREIAEPSAERRAGYDEHRAKTVLDLQLYRDAHEAAIDDGGGVSGTATLVELNPAINAWFLLILDFGNERPIATYHIENPDPNGTAVVLDAAWPHGLVLRSAAGETPCDLWTDAADPSLAAARERGRAYVRLCGDRLLLRSRTEGRKTRLESATDFLRDRIWAGEALTVFVRKNFFQDSFLETSDLIAPAATATPVEREAGAPPRLQLDPRYTGSLLATQGLELELERPSAGNVVAGRWYAVREQPGAFVATLEAKLVAPEIVAAQRAVLNPLDEVEASALVYLVAFDPARFELGFALGTDHPRVTWSERAVDDVRDEALPGPDGIGTVEPLERTGQVDPISSRRLAATFTAGFKRSHGAFKRSSLATRNFGSHYGFVEQGTVLSKLQPGLASVIVWDDGRVELKTWTEDDDARLGHVRHARQNGVPLIEPDETTGEPRPGAMVPRWTEGNWSGSQDQRLRTLRAGMCQLDEASGGFLVYGYFTSATPSGMARVFQAAGCRYALLLDMNALEHTYLATYRVEGERVVTHHLIDEMKVLDETGDGRWLPRFVAFPDNRDFFYLLRKDTPPAAAAGAGEPEAGEPSS